MGASETAKTIKVLAVCLGNICRSPAAEGVLRTVIEQKGLTDRIVVDSAGTASYHVGRPADSRMRAAANERGYPLDSMARALSPRDLRDFDFIIAMDRDNLRAIHQLGDTRQGCARLFSEFLGPEWPRDVPDPYYGGVDGFEYVLDMLEAGAPALVEYIVNEKGVQT
ncbi:MAG: low molecular weight protein-tyrosine-phosphatase [Pirellulaceae bacterium]|nr:low molecular weight protein-tyrosine-phosphatase [Pirellulaceae bacterium]